MIPRRFTLAAFATLMLVAGAALDACAHGPRVEIVAPNGAVRATVNVEIADTEASRELGLMYRRHLDENAGMIFVFAKPSHLQFWMKNTVIPLDMIFAGADRRIVGIVREARPFTEAIDAVDGDSQYVLEVNGGFCARHGVAAGDKLVFLGFAPQSRD
ncbi:DUF192 domain-containing protein [bacterium]|nr:DUF192 domain-containing protein [bacterium]